MMKAVPSPFSFKEPDSGGKEARRLRRGGKYNGLCFRAAGDSLDGQGAFSRRQGKDAGGVLYEPGPSAGSRKSEFRQLVIDGITQLEQGGGGIGNGIIRRYRIGSSVFGEDFPADGAEVGQDVEFSRIFCQGMRDEAVFRRERDFAAGRRLDYREDRGGNEPDIADVNAVPPFFLSVKVCFPLTRFMRPRW